MSFKTGYQGGPYYELFSTQGRDSTANWKISSSGIKKTYEKEVKGYAFTLEGAPATTKIQSPKDQKQSLTLVQRFFVMQVYIGKGADFSVELGVSDLGNNKRRILLSTSLKEIQVTPLHAKVPLTIVKKAVWLNLVLDMVSLVGETWTSQTFRSVDQITISANCKLRRVFTMKSQPPDTTDDEEIYGCSCSNNGEIDNLPKQCQMAADVSQFTQVLTVNKIKCAERLKSGKGLGLGEQIRPGSMLDLDLNSSGRKLQADGKIAFGSRAPRVPPDTGRRTARQGSVTNRSFKSQASHPDANTQNSMPSMSDSINSRDGILTGAEHYDFPRPRPPASASTVSTISGASSTVLYNRQQSEPVTQEDFGFININGLKENQIVAPHPPREPSNDRVRRRPRIKSIGQNGGLNRGEPSMVSPPTSALVSTTQPGSRAYIGVQSQSQSSPITTRSSQRLAESDGERSRMKDSGVGPDVPEIQSPRKDMQDPSESTNFTQYDSVADVISLLRAGRAGEPEPPREPTDSGKRRMEEERKNKEGMKGRGKRDLPGSAGLREAEDNDGNVSTSASESSHLGEYEESDEESSETNKLHWFFSPPKSAPRRNISPSTSEVEANQHKKSFVKSFRSNVKRSTDSSSLRGARLEDDFVSYSSSDEDIGCMGGNGADILHNHHHHHHHHIRNRRPPGSGNTSLSHMNHNNTNSNIVTGSSGYNSSNYTSSTTSPKFKGDRAGFTTRNRLAAKMTPKTSSSPDQKPNFDPRLYANAEANSQDNILSSVSRMSKKSLREITNPIGEGTVAISTSSSSDKPYDFTKYQVEDVTQSFEARMFVSMQRQAEEALEDISPPPNKKAASQPLRSSQHRLSSAAEGPMSTMYSESPATTSDDDTSFSTWKAPAPNLIPHNYQEEMKSRRSSDTLTSSNPRDWSGVLSPPIEPLGTLQDLHGTMEGISDDLSDEAPTNNVKLRNGLKSEDEEKLDLYFDPKLNCYYDPKTKKWYELVS